MSFTFNILVVALLGLFGNGGFSSALVISHNMPSKVSMDHSTCLDKNCDFVMLWTASEDEIVVELHVATLGWIGLGFSDDGRMVGSDMVLGWIDQAGRCHLKDAYGVGHSKPKLDPIQDYRLQGGLKNETHTVMRFSRSWSTCDTDNDYDISDDTVKIIWAYHPDLPDPSDKTMKRHQKRGVKSLYLRQPKLATTFAHDDSVFNWDVRAPNVTLPFNVDTLYWCKMFKAPELTRKHHMVGYAPLIADHLLVHVHHMILYECHINNSDHHLDKWVDKLGAQCYSRNMPVSWRSCGSPIISWAIGSEGEMFPDHVGFPLLEEHGGATYFLLETHYTNDDLLKGVVDDSGLRMFVTDELRQYEAGILEIGHRSDQTLIVPPNTVWNTVGHCVPECTQQGIPPSGVNAFGVLLHSHLLGRAIKLQHIRDGLELKIIAQDKNYDFNYQQTRFFREETILLPGDHLTTTCTYDSTDRTKPTFGGLATRNEMCLAFLQYYPKIDLTKCHSRPKPQEIVESFGIEDFYNRKATLSRFFGGFDFDESYVNKTIEDLQLEAMVLNQNTGANVRDIRLEGFYRLFVASAPERLVNVTLLDILKDESTWKDDSIIESLRRTATESSYEPFCSRHDGKKMEISKSTEIPAYVPYNEENMKCMNIPA